MHQTLLIGTYTRTTDAQGIYRANIDPQSGRVSDLSLLIEADNPSWLVRHREFVLACSEVSDAERGGEIVVYEEDADGLSLRQVVSSRGADPCHLAVHGDRLAVANYTGGTVALFEWGDAPVGAEVALLRHEQSGPHSRQESSHPHGVYFLGGELWVPDLGGDRIDRYRVTDGEWLGCTTTERRAGPRHLTADGRYVVNELDNTVGALRSGAIQATAATLPKDFAGESTTAEIVASGNRLYVSNRGHDSITVLSTEPQLAPLQHVHTQGAHPRHFVVNEGGRFILVANKDSNNLVTFRLTDDGLIGEQVSECACPSPVCLLLE